MRPTVVAAWADKHDGPGWSNTLVRALLRYPDGKLEVRAWQPDEQTDDMRTLFRVSEAASRAMREACERAMADTATRRTGG